MLYCTIHSRVYIPSLQRWLPADPSRVSGISNVMPIVEGVCDTCVEEAQFSPFAQYPDLYIHHSLTPP